jgi:hypothetical protein
MKQINVVNCRADDMILTKINDVTVNFEFLHYC